MNIDGKALAQELRDSLAVEVKQLQDERGITPGLTVILVGEDPASQVYVRNKVRQTKEVGMISNEIRMPAETSQQALLDELDKLNTDPAVHGILVQLPLPKHIDEALIIDTILPEKDVDGFHPMNIGKMVLGEPTLLSATPQGILYLLETNKITTKGKNVVVLGRSNIVGTPMAILLSRKSDLGDATVTLCHSRTENLAEITLKADIIIAAIGQAEFLKADMVKKDVVIIDVGMHRIPDDKDARGYRLTGDVDFDKVSKKASYITPVPGGVGPMTIAALLKNTLLAAKNRF